MPSEQLAATQLPLRQLRELHSASELHSALAGGGSSRASWQPGSSDESLQLALVCSAGGSAGVLGVCVAGAVGASTLAVTCSSRVGAMGSAGEASSRSGS